ncbi:MAG: hypothetical protein V4655_00475 [Bdellovibrionota bacterium]|nr:MAG: hypothetical protein EOP10_20290 [Pseudomonadota bacterium]
MRFNLLKPGPLLALAYLFIAGPLPAVTDYEPTTIPFSRELSDFKASLTPAVQDDLEKITIPLKKIRLRLANPKKDPTIEPIALMVSRSESGLQSMAEKLAAAGKKEELSQRLLAKIKKAGPSAKDSIRVEFDAEDAPLLNLKALAKELAKENHVVRLNSRELLSEKGGWDELKEQLSYVLSKDQMAKIQKKVRSGSDLSLDDDLLPPFSKRMAGKFIVYRGPNCFHASLSFFDQQLPKNPEVNIKEEEGYHRSMINYDELWRVISNQFYEIDPRNAPLKYGDLLVYFQVPETPSKHINFKWIRHTSVYLFGPYVYSKGSKSPNTPYTVKTLGEEWKVWQDMVPKALGMRIYRRGSDANARLPQSRDDWIY